MTAKRIGAGLLGALLFSYPGYMIIWEWFGVRARFPENAGSALTAVVAPVGILYGTVLVSIAARWYRRRDLTGRETFMAGLRGAAVVFVVGFVGPFIYAWLTQTEVGNIAPIVGVLGFIVGSILSAGLGLMVYAVF